MRIDNILSTAIRYLIQDFLASNSDFNIVLNLKYCNTSSMLEGQHLFEVIGYSKETFIMDDKSISFAFTDYKGNDFCISCPIDKIISIWYKNIPIINNIALYQDAR